MIPSLLQAQNPIERLLDQIGSVWFYLVVFLGAAILPAIKQAIEEKQKREQGHKKVVGPKDDRTAARPAPTSQNELERRVREFFEQQKVERPAATTTPAAPPVQTAAAKASIAPPPRPVPPPPKPPETLTELKHLHIQMEGLHAELQHLPPSRLPSQKGRRPKPAARGASPGAPRRSKSGLRTLLHDRTAVRQAILLREVLGPPRALSEHQPPR